MPQAAVFKIALAAVGIDQGARFILGDGIDGEVTSHKVLFQRDIGRRVHDEALMPRCGLAFGARQRVLFAGLRMQEHRKITPHLREAGSAHLLGRAAHHHPVTLVGRKAQQGIAHRAAHQIPLHGRWGAVTGRRAAEARCGSPVLSQAYTA